MVGLFVVYLLCYGICYMKSHQHAHVAAYHVMSRVSRHLI